MKRLLLLFLLLPTFAYAQDDAFLPVHDHDCQIRLTSGFFLCYSELRTEMYGESIRSFQFNPIPRELIVRI